MFKTYNPKAIAGRSRFQMD